MSTTSVNNDQGSSGNEDPGSDGLGNKTFGEQATPAPAAGAESIDPAAGAACANPADSAFPDTLNVGPSPLEKAAAEEKLPKF